MNNEGQKKCFLVRILLMSIILGMIIVPVSALAGEKQIEKRTHTVVIGTELGYPPYSFLDENGKATGYNIELTEAVGRVMDLDIEVRIGPWGEIRQALETGEIDAIAGMYYSVERDKQVDFSAPYTIVHHAIFVRRGTPAIETEEDLRGKEIIVMRGDIMHDYVLEKGLFGKPVLVDTQANALRLLASGKHDCALGAKLPGLYLSKELGLSNIVTVGPLLRPSDYSYAVSEGNAALQHLLGEGLAALGETGAHKEINDKWLGVLEPRGVPMNTVFKYIALAVVPLLLILAFFAVWSRTLKRQVAQRTKDLRESEENLRITLDSIGDAVIATDTSGNVTRMNPVAGKLTGWRVEDTQGKPLTDVFNIINARTKEKAANPVAKVLENGKITGLANHAILISKDGSQYQIADSGAPIRDAGGNTTGAVLVFRDVTEEYEMQEALRESEAKYRAMMESMKEPIYICSPDYRIEYMNPAMIRRNGRYAVGEPCFKAIHDLEKKCPWCPHHKTQTGKQFGTDIVSPKDKHSYHITHAPIVHGDRSISTMTIFRDTTELRKMETQLQQAQKMESIGTLAGGIAHDFNNILFPIIGYTEMIMDDVPEKSTVRKNLNEILKSALRAKGLVKQILTFSRQQNQELKPLKVQVVVKEALKLIRSTLPTTIEIRQDIDKDCGPVVSDSTQMHQIVMNLCTNAYHAMEETGGTLEVNLSEVELTVDDITGLDMEPGPYLCLRVGDTGHGMDRSVTGRVFDPYFTTKETGKGTGLGLSVVHGIVKSYGGDIRIYSELGKGTVFHVYMPQIKAAVVSSETVSDEALPVGHECILLVDDEDQIVSLEKVMLERLGYQVASRTSSIEALEAFRKQPDKFDLVITDMTMPNMTGKELVKELMSIRSDIPIILCTGFSEQIDERRAKKMGIRAFVMKPVVMREIANTIRQVLDKK